MDVEEQRSDWLLVDVDAELGDSVGQELSDEHSVQQTVHGGHGDEDAVDGQRGVAPVESERDISKCMYSKLLGAHDKHLPAHVGYAQRHDQQEIPGQQPNLRSGPGQGQEAASHDSLTDAQHGGVRRGCALSAAGS